MTFYTAEDVAFGLPEKKKEEIKIDPLTSLIDRPEILDESPEIRQSKVLAS